MHTSSIDEYIAQFDYSAKRNYTKFKKWKRLICSPNEPLRWYQYIIKNWLESIYSFPSYITWFRKWISIQDNAKIHHNQDFIMAIDIVDFFGNIKIWDLQSTLKPLKLKNLDKLLEFITLEWKLPQWSPSSPILSNITFEKIDYKLVHFLKQVEPNITYSRYVDDISIWYNLKQNTPTILEGIKNTLLQYWFKINTKKYRVFQKGKHQKITWMILSEEHIWIWYKKYRIVRKIIYNYLRWERGYYPSIKWLLLYIKWVDFYRYIKLKEVFNEQFSNESRYQELFSVDKTGNPIKKLKKNFFHHLFNFKQKEWWTSNYIKEKSQKKAIKELWNNDNVDWWDQSWGYWK